MEPTRDARSTQPKIKKRRDRLRPQGLRPDHVWVPDVQNEAFTAEASRQSALVAASPYESEDLAFVDAASAGVWDGE